MGYNRGDERGGAEQMTEKTRAVTPFGALLAASGLSQSEAADYLDVRLSQIKDMAVGRRPTPPGVIAEMSNLVEDLRHEVDRLIAEGRTSAAELSRCPYPAGAQLALYGHVLARLQAIR